jgi:Icc-related predicted phosphoesterase
MRLPGLRRVGQNRDRPTGGLKLYYASDVHGAEQCWRKFLGAGRFYAAEALIMGGDIAGKAIVPIELAVDGAFSAEFLGERHHGRSDDQLAELQAAVRYNGFYPYVAPADELARYREDEAARDELFERVMIGEAERWIQIGDQRSDDNGIPVYVMAGNDDPWALDDVLRDAQRVISSEDGVVRVGEHEMISCSYANPTPWNSPRELSEDRLYDLLKSRAEQLEAPASAIFNLHAPPYDTGLDTANQVNEDLTLATNGGEPVQIPVGSRAVRQIIEEYQPALALHGHIHESRGTARIGRTLCINPGSEYNTGRIHGVLVTLGASDVLRSQFVVG